jgi:hypothetical protein
MPANPTPPLLTCPHCGTPLVRVAMPENGGWQDLEHLACFNDDCGYYVRGWEWMREHFAVHASYRFHLDPATGVASPLPVWSATALRDRLVEDDAAGGTAPASGVIPDDLAGNGGSR